MTRLLHISDLHFGPKFLPDVAEGVLRFAAAVRPEAVVVSGDLTQRAKRRQFEAAAAFLRRFGLPVVVTPGNHDVPLYRVWERFAAPYRLYRAYIGDALDTVTRLPGAVIVAVHSTRRFTFTNGRIRRRQLAFVRDAFRDAPPEAARIVVTHHHLAPPPDFEGGNVMPGARRALRAFARCGVELVLAGHMHRSYIGSSLDFVPRHADERGIVILQCGTTTSRRGRGRERFRNALNLIEIEPDRFRIVHALWAPDAAAFRPASLHVFPRGGGPYLAGTGDGA
jgi:3',5'-cyclic AMP phosphodiesterase CpdA